MGSILEKIEQALKDMLIGWIESNLTNMFTDVNEKVGTIAAEVGQTPSGWNGGVYQMIRGLSENVIVPIAGIIITFVLCYPFLSDAEAQRFGTGKEEIGKCPRCGSPVYVGKGNFYCSNKECSFCLWEDNKFFSSKKKKLTKRIAKELLDKGWCRVTGLYTPKKPQLYDAVIRLDDSGGKYVSFKMEFDR